MMLLSEAANAMQGVLHGADTSFSKIHTDTRSIAPDALFVALRGEHFDGHQFLENAQQSGAVAAVVDHFNDQLPLPQIVVANTTTALGQLGAYWRSQFAGKIIAVTGSSGKTTVKGLLHAIFSSFTSVHATPGNWNNHIGVPLTLFGLADQTIGVIELGTNHAGEISYLAELVRPDVALVNNIMPAHIEGFGSLENIAQEKSAIYSYLLPEQTAVINLQDSFAQNFVQQTGFCQQIGFGASTSGPLVTSVWASAIKLNDIGCASFNLHLGGDQYKVQLALPGEHNVQNALAAAACASAVNCPAEQIVKGLQQFAGEKGRMQVYSSNSGARIVDDTYNANPGSVKAAIRFLQQCSGKRILVLGDMGELGETCDDAHTELGQFARTHNVDELYTVGEKAALATHSFGVNAKAFSSQSELIAQLKPALTAQSTVLIKGSRCAHMEHVVEALCQKEKAPC